MNFYVESEPLPMKIQVGYELVYQCPQPTPMVVTLSIHYSRVSDIIQADHLLLTPSVRVTAYRDLYGNWCSRIVAPAGQIRLSGNGVVSDTGNPDPVLPWLEQRPVETLPQEALLFLLGSRYCETDLLSETAWQLFGTAPTGWKRVQAICDFVHQHIRFGYGLSSPTKSAFQVFQDRQGVCRDFAHLAVTFCRCMNIPARYCTGYLGDIGIPPNHFSHGLCGLVRGLSRRRLVHLRSSKQYAPHWARPDRQRQRRGGCRAHHQLRIVDAGKLQGVDG